MAKRKLTSAGRAQVYYLFDSRLLTPKIMFSISQYLSQVDGSQPSPSSSQLSVLQPNKKKNYADLLKTIKDQTTSKSNKKPNINDIKPSRNRYITIPRPSQEEVEATTERTRKALEIILQQKLGKTSTTNKSQSEFIRYNSTNVLNSGAATSSRLIKIVDVQQDPMAPPKFKQKKQFEAAPFEPIAPILHAPVAKLSQEEQKKWYIPPAISNWKNPNGYSIALDKRLAVNRSNPNLFKDEGMNENFVNLSKALDDADKKARDELKMRNAMKKRQLEEETKQKEEQLKLMAEKAREKRFGNRDYNVRQTREYQERLQDRENRRRRAQRELKLNRSNDDRTKQFGKNRDISERTEMSQTKTTKKPADSQFDSRLFTNSVVPQHSETEVYDKPLFLQKSVSNFFRAQNDDGSVKDLGPVEFVKGDDSMGKRAPEEANDEEEDNKSNKRQKL